MRKNEKNFLEKDGLLYFNKPNQMVPSKQQIAQGYPAGSVSFYKIAAITFSVLLLLSILFFVQRLGGM